MMLQGMPPRCGKSFMTEALNQMISDINSSYNEAYSKVFTKLKQESGDIYSDEELREWIDDNLVFKVKVDDSSFTETPKLFIVVELREVPVE